MANCNIISKNIVQGDDMSDEIRKAINFNDDYDEIIEEEKDQNGEEDDEE